MLFCLTLGITSRSTAPKLLLLDKLDFRRYRKQNIVKSLYTNSSMYVKLPLVGGLGSGANSSYIPYM